MAMALSPTARLVMGDAPPQSESDEDDFEALTMTGAVASTLDPSVRFAKYAEIEEVVGVGHLLCEECERDEAVCRCEACAETLCSRCFVLTHPPRAGGAEHDHLRHGLVRGISEADASGATARVRAGTVGFEAPGCHLCHDGWDGSTSELTEEDLLRRGVDLAKSTCLEAPKINYCVGDVERDVEGEAHDFRAGEVVLIISEEGDREDLEEQELWERARAETNGDDDQTPAVVGRARFKRRVGAEDEGDDSSRSSASKFVSSTPAARLRRERWGVILDVPKRSYRNIKPTKYKRGDVPGVARIVGDGGEHLYRVRSQGEASGDYAFECEAAENERVTYLAGLDDELKKQTGFIAAARLGFVTRNASQFRAPPRLELDASKPVVLCRNEHLVRPRDRLAVLLKAREAACAAVVAAADRRYAGEMRMAMFYYWVEVTQILRREERRTKATVINLWWRRKRLQLRHDALNASVMEEAYARTRRIHAQFKYLTTDEEKRQGYTTDGRVYFKTLEELKEYTKLLREKGEMICDTIMATAAANLLAAFQLWRDGCRTLRERQAVGKTHVDRLTPAQEAELAAGLDGWRDFETTDSAANAPWHPAAWNSNLQPDFNVRICDSFDATSLAVLRELDESNRFVQRSAESTSI